MCTYRDIYKVLTGSIMLNRRLVLSKVVLIVIRLGQSHPLDPVVDAAVKQRLQEIASLGKGRVHG